MVAKDAATVGGVRGGLEMLQEVAGTLEEAAGPTQQVADIFDGLNDAGSRFRLHKAARRYWRTWLCTLRERDICLEQLSAPGSPLSFDGAALDADQLSAAIETASAAFEEQWRQVQDELSEALAADEGVSKNLAEQLSAAQSLFEARKRAEAEEEVQESSGRLSEERHAKRDLRLKLQKDEESFRVEAQRIENVEIAEAKALHTEVSNRCKVLSHNTLMRKIRFEESAEALRLFLEDLDEETGETEELSWESGGDPRDDVFSCRAGVFLSAIESETEKHQNVLSMTASRLEGQHSAVEALSSVSWITSKLDENFDVETLTDDDAAAKNIACVLAAGSVSLLPSARFCVGSDEEECLVVWPRGSADWSVAAPPRIGAEPIAVGEIWSVRRPAAEKFSLAEAADSLECQTTSTLRQIVAERNAKGAFGGPEEMNWIRRRLETALRENCTAAVVQRLDCGA